MDNNDMKKEVEVHSVLTVVSSTPVEPGRTCVLTRLDHAMGHHDLHVIFYYRSGLFSLGRIRPALNEVLSLYPNVTGRLAKDGVGNWEIKCSDAGVRVFLAKAKLSIDEWLRSAGYGDQLRLTAAKDLLDVDDRHYWSPFRIQVTEFEGGGTAIAVSCPHMLADPTCVTLLIKAWTEVHHNEPIAHPPFFQTLALKSPSATTISSPSAAYYATKSMASNPQLSVKMATATFSFSDSMVKRTLSEINSAVPDASPFDLLTALFWMRITRLKSRANHQKQSISIIMDIRKRLNAPLPYGYFGNALHFSEMTVDANKLDGADLGHVAGLVHQHMSGFKEEEFWSAINWLHSRTDDQGKYDPPFRMYGPELTCVSMEHMIAPTEILGKDCLSLMYMARFEKDQKPVHVSYQVGNAEGEGLILVMPSPEEGLSRRVAVILPEDEMEQLLQDKLVLNLEPTLLLSGRS